MNSSCAAAASDRLKYLATLMVQTANSGHPGAPMGQSDFLSILFSKYLNISPDYLSWANRDRFILSCGHASAGLYALYHSCGFQFTMEDLKNFRQLHSKTAGHPEYELPIEATTGPLGQGLTNAVGQAIAGKRLQKLFGSDVIDYKVYVCVSDGCLSEGVSHEVLSLAGHLGLDNLVILYDSNGITIDGALDQSFSEDMKMRVQALGLIYDKVDGHDITAIDKALGRAQGLAQPHLIEFKTKIGKFLGAPLEGSSASHGAPVGPEVLSELKQKFSIEHDWSLPKEHYDFFDLRSKNNDKIKAWHHQHEARLDKALTLKSFSPSLAASELLVEATRKTMARQLSALQQQSAVVIGGSCDLAASCHTTFEHSEPFTKDNYGNNIAFGIREFGAAGVCNGIAQAGLLPFTATFLVFSDFMLPAIRLSALSKHKVLYIFTHDSIAVGEDGPTHQPVEQLTHLRDIPGLSVYRPHNTTECFTALSRHLTSEGPSAVILSRQKFTQHLHLDSSQIKGAYFIKKAQSPIAAILASGSEVDLAMKVADKFKAEQGLSLDVLSISSLKELSNKDLQAYLSEKSINAFALEASTGLHWLKFIPFENLLNIQGFGLSGPGDKVYEYKGLCVKKIITRLAQVVLNGEADLTKV